MLIRRTTMTALALATLTILGCEEPSARSAEPQPQAVTPAEGERLDARPSPTGAAANDFDCPVPDASGVTTRPLVFGRPFEQPIFVTQPPGEDDVVYVVERTGRVLMVANGRVLRKPFLDIRRYLVSDHPEQGLLGLAFHPDFAKNGRFYLHYTPGGQPRNIVAEWALKFDEPYEVRRLVEVDDPHPANNGGMLGFGPDGLLYAGMGDGGGPGDPHGIFGNAQDGDTPLGSILRIDVDAPSRGLDASADPYIDEAGQEFIWAKGLRNPWRFSFDSKTGDLYVADIGQTKYEEVSVVPPETDSYLNLGWRAYEGFMVYDDDLTDMFDEHHEPVITYRTRDRFEPIRRGCAIVGGYVYRGDSLPSLSGAYIYGDRCSKDVAAFSYCSGKVIGHQRLRQLSGQADGLTSFGRDNRGELYMTFSDGQVRQVVRE